MCTAAGRFNERMVLSMASCPNILLVDDELNVLPTSTMIKSIEPVELDEDGLPRNSAALAAQRELKQLGESLSDTQVRREGGRGVGGGGRGRGCWHGCGLLAWVRPAGRRGLGQAQAAVARCCACACHLAAHSAEALRCWPAANGRPLPAAQPAGALVSRCRTLDQARALVTFLDASSEKTLRSTVALTASRGRGARLLPATCPAVSAGACTPRTCTCPRAPCATLRLLEQQHAPSSTHPAAANRAQHPRAHPAPP